MNVGLSLVIDYIMWQNINNRENSIWEYGQQGREYTSKTGITVLCNITTFHHLDILIENLYWGKPA